MVSLPDTLRERHKCHYLPNFLRIQNIQEKILLYVLS